MDSQSPNLEDPGQQNVKKIKKDYDSNFQDDWTRRNEYKNWIKKENKTTARCVQCNITFTVRHDGEKAVRTHLNSTKHTDIAKSIATNTLTAFVSKTNLSEATNVAVAELSHVYHGLCHHHSYLSTDCGMKLNVKVYSDSSIAKKIHCGRTKAETLVENVLAPKSLEITLRDMGSTTVLPVSHSALPFSVATDASNKGNRKLFPIAVKYFDEGKGLQNKVLDFYEDADESSAAIAQRLAQHIADCGLDINNVSSYSADNASVNYGKFNSVFQKLSDLNGKIIKANCNCHIIHNAARNACKVMSYDTENLVLKVFAEFSNSAKRRETLECFEFMGMEFQEVLRHVITRWLSLFKAIDRLLSSWPAIKAYFLEEGEDNCQKIIWYFIKEQEHEVGDDVRSALTLPECYLYFVHHFMNLMTKSLLRLESNTVTSAEVHEVMSNLRDQLKCRIHDEFFGSKVNSALKHLRETEKAKFKREALQVYNRAISYLDKWYDFDGNPFQFFSALSLTSDQLSYEKIIDAKNAANVNLDEDLLYDEVQLVNKCLPMLQEAPVDIKWVRIFRACSHLAELPKLVSKILSIPVSNSFVERLFSIMSNVWTDERNRMRVELVKAELMVKMNFNMTCSEFFYFVKKPEQESLLRSAMRNEKYKFKNKTS